MAAGVAFLLFHVGSRLDRHLFISPRIPVPDAATHVGNRAVTHVRPSFVVTGFPRRGGSNAASPSSAAETLAAISDPTRGMVLIAV